jgi:uroporphyrinogen decarboxylase
LKLKYLPPLLEQIEFDYANGWEDICYNSGPLISPKAFQKLIVPHMKPVLELLRQHGIDIIYTDCDGNIEALLPHWMESGLNAMFPLEVQANNNIERLRQKYGRQLLVLGGFDKFALLQGKAAVLKELKRLEPFVMEGGFIPFIDHRCPDGVDFAVYQYYMREKLSMLGYTPGEIAGVPALAGMD